jgi:DNA polymerase III alpha subunit (gram-positive type)
MILLGVDLETTGLSPETDRPIELGAILYSTGQKKCLESTGLLIKSDVSVSERITELTGITQSAVDKFGYPSRDALGAFLDMAEQADAYIGQNVIQFDKRFFQSWVKREGMVLPEKLWIDTRTDIPGVEGKHLGYMAADAGFLNMFPHSALSDVQTVLKLIEGHDINKIVERAQSPTIVILGHQARTDNDLAKARKFRWNPAYGVWWKTIKYMDLKQEEEAAKFNISLAPPEILIEKLWYDN